MTINKNTDLEFSLQQNTEKGGVYTNFYTEDKGSASIRIRLSSYGRYLDLTKIDLEPVLFLFHDDGSIFEIKDFINVMPEQGLIQYDFSDNIIRHAGKVKAKMFLKSDTKSVHVANFSFEIKDSGIEDAVGKEITLTLVKDTLVEIIQENSLKLLPEDFRVELFDDIKDYLLTNNNSFQGAPGIQGVEGEKGDTGKPFTYQDFTFEQLEELRQPIRTEVSDISNRVSKIYGLSQSPVNIYVSKTGNNTGNGTQGNPFNSIQKAFDSIPKIIDKRYTVWIAPGDYDEEAYLTGVIGGTIFVRSTEPPETVDNINVRVKALNFYDIMGYVHIEDMGTYGGEINRKAFILFSRCIYGSVSRCRMDRAIPGKITLYWDGSFGSLGISHIENQELVIQSQNGSTVRIDSNTTSGTGNGVALYSLNGFIFKSGANDWINTATTPEKKEIGGQIYSDTNNWTDLSYSNGWATNSGAALKYKKMSDDLVMLYGWVNKQPLDTTVIATLPVGYRPINTQRHAVTVTGTAAVQTSLPVLEVRTNGDIRLVSTGNVPSNNGIAINIMFPIL